MSRARIAEIELTGVKARDRKVRLGLLQLLLGGVGTGKSGVTDALKFAALGAVPHLGDREVDTARIMRGPKMGVRVTLSDGRWFTRTLERDAKGALRGDARASWMPTNATATAQGEAIRALFGGSKVDAAECLDLKVFLAGSAAQRATRMEQLLSATTSDRAGLETLLRALTLARLGGVDESRLPEKPAEARAATEGLKGLLPKPVAEVIDELIAETRGELGATGIPGALERANRDKNAAKQDASKKVNARAELEQRSMSLAVPSDTLDDLNARRQTATDRIATLRAQIDTVTNARTARTQAEEADRTARTALAANPQQRAYEEDRTAAAKRLREEADAIKDPPEVPAPTFAEADAEQLKEADRQEAQAAESRKQRDAIVLVQPTPPTLATEPDWQSVQDASTDADAALKRAREGPWARVADIADVMEERAKHVTGVNSGAEQLFLMDRVVELRKLVAANDTLGPAKAAAKEAAKRLREVEDKVSAVRADNTRLTKAHAKATAAYDKLSERRQALDTEATEHEAAARTARALAQREAVTTNEALTEAYEDAVAKRAAVVDANTRRRKRLRGEAEAAATEAETARRGNEQRDTAAREAAAKLAGVKEVAPGDIDTKEDEIAQLQADVERIDESKRAVEGADARKVEMDTLVGEIEAAQAEQTAWTAIEWALQRLRERDLAARGGPILKVMRSFLRGAQREEDPYIRATKGATDFGWRRGGQEIPLEALSGGETVLFTTALAAAVVSLRGPELRVLIIEAAELGAAKPVHSILAGCGAVRAELENVIVATCNPIDPPQGWTTEYMNGDTVTAPTPEPQPQPMPQERARRRPTAQA